MGGMLKHLFWIAPLAAIILFFTWYQSRENVADIRVQEHAFDRDWNESMTAFSKNPAQTAKYQQRAAAAQTRYSSALIEQQQKHEQMKEHEQGMNQALQDIDKQLQDGKK